MRLQHNYFYTQKNQNKKLNKQVKKGNNAGGITATKRGKEVRAAPTEIALASATLTTTKIRLAFGLLACLLSA